MWFENTDGLGQFQQAKPLVGRSWFGRTIGSDLDMDGDLDIISMAGISHGTRADYLATRTTMGVSIPVT